ncbi:DUF6247 family protein [Kitasatospora sp. NPDC059088]|uniref:DUF6247 family protein n=1 Tax=Kitasatospora sp. NPDC059088 TaxID=3346722 RepID=UPI0036B1C8A9
MNTTPVHGRQPVARTQGAVAAALPPAQRKEFHREMDEADEETIDGVLRRWWLRAQLYRDPEGDRIQTAVRSGTAPGTPASTVLRRLGAP